MPAASVQMSLEGKGLGLMLDDGTYKVIDVELAEPMLKYILHDWRDLCSLQ